MTDGDVQMVPNNYLRSLRAARRASVTPAASLEDMLGGAETAMENGAWVGGEGDNFASELAGHRAAIREAGPSALETFDDAIGRQPEQVESTDWRVNWRTRGPI